MSTGDLYNPNYGQVFKISLTGQFTTISPAAALAAGVVEFVGPMIFGQDGNIYVTAWGGVAAGFLLKSTLSGVVSPFYTFCKQSGCPDSTNPTGIIQAPDGSFFGTTFHTIFHFQSAKPTCTNSAPPVITSIQSASAYGGYNYFASGSWLEIKGTNLADPADPCLTAATNPGQWTSGDFSGVNAPTWLDGISVNIDNKPAYIWYISPAQVNVQAPQDSTIANVSINATNCMGTSGPVTLPRRAAAPGLLAPSNYSSGGKTYLVATFASDGAYVLNTALGASFGLNARPAKSGDVVIAYGIGFGDVTPATLPGVIVQAVNTLASPVMVSFGTTPAAISYQGLAGGFVGLYEFFITVPAGLAPGDYQINVAQGGTALPQTFYLTIGN